MHKKFFTAILLTALTVGQSWADNVSVDGFGSNTWYNYKSSSYGGGDGSSGSPYLISTPEQLALLAYSVNEGGQTYSGQHFSVTANLSLDKTVGGKVVWVPIGRNSHSFKGTVTGNGHSVSGMTITATSTSYTHYFGLFGTIEDGSISSLTVKDASITLTANDWADVGGLIGECNDNLTDCHAVANITCTNTGSEEISVGGLAGSCTVSNVSHCSSSGSITGSITATGSESEIIMGGLIGYAQTISTTATAAMTYCCTATSLKGGTTVGGLMGQLNIGTNKTDISSSFSCSFIDATSATYAGGVFGDLQRSSHTTAYDSDISCQYCGTMVKPSASTRYGVAFGNTNLPYNAGFDYFSNHSFTYDSWLCDLPTNGMGYDLAGKVSAITTPLPAAGGYTLPSTAKAEATFKDNFILCSQPTYITNDAKHFFPPKDVTTSFNMVYDVLGEQVTYVLAENSNSIEVKGRNLQPLDPSEALLTIRCNDVERKALIKVNYGTEWDGQTATGFDGGNGSFLDPYLIRTVSQLRLAISNTSLYNKEGMNFRLANDIFINKHLLQTNEEPRSGAHQWTSANFAANLDGDGHTIYGLYVRDEDCTRESAHGLFATLTGKVSRLAMVDSYVWASGSASEICAGTICGVLTGDGALEQCMAHGRVLSDGMAGGMVGSVDDNNNALTDCFSCVHVGWATSNDKYVGAGLISDKETNDGKPVVTNCISTGKVEYDYNNSYGLVRRGTVDTNSCFDLTMMASNFTVMDEDYSSKPANMISGQMLADAANWKTELRRYPMLKLFAETPYGDLLSMPLLFAEGDRAGKVTQVFDFPNEGVIWSAYNGSTYIDVINSCGAASPVSSTESNTEFLIAQTSAEAKSQSTKALRVMAIDVKVSSVVGLTFEDDKAATACLAAFDADHNDKVTLREAVEATSEQFTIFNAQAASVQTFRELRYFVGLTTLSEGMISGLPSLTAVELPKTLTTISDNAFNGCSALESITLPVSATTATGLSFYGSGIKNIYVEPKSTNLVSRNGMLFNTNDDLMAYPPSRGEASATVSGALNAILPYAFYQVPGLTSIYLDNALPEGHVAELAENGIVNGQSSMVDIYINDGSYNGVLYEDYLDDSSWEDYEDRLHRYFPLTVTGAGWATLYIGFATQLPSELKAYIVTESSVTNNEATLKRVDNLLPATTPVVIRSEQAGTYLLMPYTGVVDPLDKWENKLIGSSIGQEKKWGVPVNQGDANEGSILTLGRSQGEVGFFYYQGTQIPPYRAYLTYNSIQDPNARFMLHIDDSEESGIAETLNRQSSYSILYDLQGRPLSNLPTRGVYIKDGKVVVIH